MRDRTQRVIRHGLIWATLAAGLAVAVPVGAQFGPPKMPPNERQVYLVRQDVSDCTNSNVPNVDSPLTSGNVWVTRGTDGTTSVQLAMTLKPYTTYHFFLKCVRLLGNVPTDAEGVANVTFSFPTNSVGAVYAFDMYPDGAPSGQKFQSAQVSFQ
jgi:hypothetical protein